MKKIKYLFLIFGIFLGIFLGETSVYASDVDVSSKACILIEAGTGKILYENNQDEKLAIASVSKIVTMYMVNNKIANGGGNWDDIVDIDDYLLNISTDGVLGGTPLYKDQKYKVEDLYKAMILESSNSSTMALGNWVSGNQTQYIKDANKWLTDTLGLRGYEYVSASGLENSDIPDYMVDGSSLEDYNKFSARDVSVIARQLINDFPDILNITKNNSGKMSNGYELKNSNSLVKGNRNYDESINLDGLKTGYTSIAGHTFVGTGEKNGMRLISVTLNSNDYAQDTKNLLNYGYNNYRKMEINNKDIMEGDKVNVKNGVKSTAKVKFNNEKKVLVVKNSTTEKDIKASLSANEVNAPIIKDQPVSILTYTDNTDTLGYLYDSGKEVSILSDEEIAESKEDDFSSVKDAKAKEKTNNTEDNEDSSKNKKDSIFSRVFSWFKGNNRND